MPEAILSAKVDLATVSILAILTLLVALFWSASKRGLSCLDLITDKGSGKMSLTKVLNLLGAISGTWVVMRMAVDKSLDPMTFAIFLGYCAGTHAFSTWLSARYRPGESKPDKPKGDHE